MRTITLLICIFLTGIMFAQNKVDANGKKQGPWEKKYPKSLVSQYKGQFKDDKPVGTFTYYYPSNKVQAIIKNTPNSSRSSAIFYHESGVVLSKGIYMNMKKDSIWLNFAPSGRLSTSETYKNDKLNGQKIIYFLAEDLSDRSLRIASTSNYIDGLMNGERIEYFESGTIKTKGNYKNNKKTGIWVTNHPNGKPMNTERYKDGVLHGWCTVQNEGGVETGRVYFYHGTRLEGKKLEEKMKQFKKLGLDPNN